MKTSHVALATAIALVGSLAPAFAGVPMRNYLDQKKAKVEAEYRAQKVQDTLYSNARTVGVGENLGRNRKSSVLNYVLYGGRDLVEGKPVLVLHKVERSRGAGGLFKDGAESTFIISYRYIEPDEIYIQGAYLKILEFDNIQIKFVVLEGRNRLTATED